MRLKQLLEAPIGDFGTIGDFSDPNASIPDASDRRAVTVAPMVKRITTAWEKTPFLFNLFFANVPGAEKWVEHGYVQASVVRDEFPEMASRILAGRADKAITVVFTNNIGDEGISFTPWIMAHRISHAMVVPNNAFDLRQGLQNPKFNDANELVIQLSAKFKSECEIMLGISMQGFPVAYYARPFYEHIGTMRSARSKKLSRPYEFSHEVFAQYLLTGSVQFNPITPEFMKEFATEILGPVRAEARNYASEDFLESVQYVNRKIQAVQDALPNAFAKGLTAAQGKVIFM